MPHVELPQAEFKLVMLGESFTGKTSLVLRFAEGYYRESSRNPTVGAFFITKRLTVQGMTAKIQIWDTAGQEQFKRLAPMYYKNAAAAIICYDVTSPKSFETLEYWMDKLRQNIAEGGIVIAMCATKCDLEDHPDTSKAEALAAETGAIFLKTSSKTNSNVHQLFEKVTEKVLDYQRENAGLSPVTLATTAVETASPPESPIRSPKNATPIGNHNQQISPTEVEFGLETGGCVSPLCASSPFVDEKKMDLDELDDLVDAKNKETPDNSSIKHVTMSRFMCGDVVGMAEDGDLPGCCMQ